MVGSPACQVGPGASPRRPPDHARRPASRRDNTPAMKASRVHRFGDPLQLDELPEPQAGPREVVVDLEFIGVNPVDIWVTRGTVAGGSQPLPFVPGLEAAGSANGRRYVVRAPGFGVAVDGFYREREAVRDSALIPLPEGMDPAQAAA